MSESEFARRTAEDAATKALAYMHLNLDFLTVSAALEDDVVTVQTRPIDLYYNAFLSVIGDAYMTVIRSEEHGNERGVAESVAGWADSTRVALEDEDHNVREFFKAREHLSEATAHAVAFVLANRQLISDAGDYLTANGGRSEHEPFAKTFARDLAAVSDEQMADARGRFEPHADEIEKISDDIEEWWARQDV